MPELTRRLDRALRELYRKGYRVFWCGGAQGFDMLCAERTLYLRARHPDVRLHLALPCADQTRYWPDRQCNLLRYFIGAADYSIVLAEHYFSGCMMVRNRYMVDRSSCCLCYLVHLKGGTMSTVAYAIQQKIKVKNLAMSLVRKE